MEENIPENLPQDDLAGVRRFFNEAALVDKSSLNYISSHQPPNAFLPDTAGIAQW